MITYTQHIKVIKLFNSIVLEKDQKTVELEHSLVAKNGVITNFIPDDEQKKALKEVFQKISITTLFGKKEREEASLEHLLVKQLLHYIEVYGLNSPGLFDLEVTKGKILPIAFVKGITKKELSNKVRTLIYANAPIKDVALVKEIIADFDIDYDINLVANNELRIQLFDWTKQTLDNGDDVVRYLCYKATGNSMLIKSKKVIEAVHALVVSPDFIKKHEIQLANVFNRHKRIILALKHPVVATTAKNPVLKPSDIKNLKLDSKENVSSLINRITRLSKQHHVPIKEAINKTFVALALAKKVDQSVLEKISIRDKFKYLNLLEYKKQGFAEDVFVIRNGKVHLEKDRTVYSHKEIDHVINMVTKSLKDDLSHLKGTNILLDTNVDFGLPVSRKQAFGRVPFGTKITVSSKKNISSGVYWRNEWGIRDLDLSTVDKDGNRTGWGARSGFTSEHGVTYSGDVTSAPDGAMEFMTSKNQSYGIFVNIFNGEKGSECELVIGTDGKNKWIKDTVFREKGKLESIGSILGFVENNSFIVYNVRINENRVSSGSNNKTTGLVRRGTGKFWTVTDVLDAIGVDYDTVRKENVVYDTDLSYNGFSYDLLETLFSKKVEMAVDKVA